jgi:hypothetical protein
MNGTCDARAASGGGSLTDARLQNERWERKVKGPQSRVTERPSVGHHGGVLRQAQEAQHTGSDKRERFAGSCQTLVSALGVSDP